MHINHYESVPPLNECAKKPFLEPPDRLVFNTVSRRETNFTEDANLDIWHGTCFDNGAQTTFIGLGQAKSYCRFMVVKFKPEKNNHLYLFGNYKQTSLGSITIRIPIIENIVVTEHVDVIDFNFSFLVALDPLVK